MGYRLKDWNKAETAHTNDKYRLSLFTSKLTQFRSFCFRLSCNGKFAFEHILHNKCRNDHRNN